jgi:hypothetical protein
MGKSTEDKRKEITEFYKSVFCIDGEAKLRFDVENFKVEGIVELNDAKRGKFFIGQLIIDK